MTEINLEPMKQAIQDYADGRCANFSNKQFIKWLSSLITTIESQKEEIRRRVIQAEINIGLGQTVIDMQSEIKSLKAITELAVKGLKEELIHSTKLLHYGSMARLEHTLSKIERLTNEQT